MDEPYMDEPWWTRSVGYQIYVRSYADANGDGLGDLPGILERIDHVAWLGADVVWINPFFPSPMRDAGYDVADYCGVDDRFGQIADFDAVVARAHELGLRVVIDVVPNHTSSDHPWFVAARSARDDPYRDYYIWRDPAPDGGPPNNWASVFGGRAWTYDDATGQYWLHLFLPQMPDLNWAHPAVADEFDAILRFWLERGVDGFRVDVAHALTKHPALPDLPEVTELADGRRPLTGASRTFDGLAHVYDFDQPDNVEVYRRWRRVVAEHDALLLGEVYLLDAAAVRRYVADQSGLHLSFWFGPLHCDWDADALRATLREAVAELGRWVSWPLGNHDRPRTASAFGGGAPGRERALALATLMFGLPGLPFVYQGEELGLDDVEVPVDQLQDPIARHSTPERARDRARTPMPWEPVPGFGFTTGGTQPWLPFGPRTDADTVAGQRADPDSTLRRYRALVAVRREVGDLTADTPTRWLDAPGEAVIAYRRGDALVVANTGDDPVAWPLPAGRWRVRFSSTSPDDERRTIVGEAALAPRQALVLTPDPSDPPAAG